MVSPITLVYDRGFTLLEVIIYLALFSLLMTSVLGVVYQLVRSTAETKWALQVQAEGNFIIQKMEWALAGQTTIILPNEQTCVITRADQGSESPVEFSVRAGTWYVKRGMGSSTPLSSSAMRVHDVVMQQNSSGIFTVIFWLDDWPFYFTSTAYE